MKKQITKNDVSSLDFLKIEDEWEQKKLLKFWDEVPLTQYIDAEKFELIDSHSIRNSIVKILRKGVKIDEKNTLRALSIKDLRELVNIELGKEIDTGNENSAIKYTALYYHRDKLLEHGLIQVISEVLIGRRYVAFYGRTAKAFLARNVLGYKHLDLYDKLNDFMIEKNPNLSSNQIDQLYEDMAKRSIEVTNEFDNWVEDHVELINKHDIDVIELYKFFSNFYAFHPQLKEKSLKIGKYLDLPIFEDY